MVSRDALTIETKDGYSERLEVSGSTQITIDGQQKSLGDLREGVQLRASYDERGGDRTVTRIEAHEGEDRSSGDGIGSGSDSTRSGPSSKERR